AALAALPAQRPAVVLMDLNLPGISGVECTARLKSAVPGVQILVLTAYGETDLIFDALRAGASGYLLKRTAPAELLAAVKEVVSGGAPMSPEIARKVVESFRRSSPVPRGEDELTPREREVLSLLSGGLTDKEIADRIHVSYETVRSHMKHIYDKLHVHSRTEAVVRFLSSEGAGATARRNPRSR
ncbi:MAG: response regulator transcription factor, partial [Verrucomicrobiae bacterium]|nr:response regulator transcription factor [Verrucomicrobiae bacterium]